MILLYFHLYTKVVNIWPYNFTRVSWIWLYTCPCQFFPYVFMLLVSVLLFHLEELLPTFKSELVVISSLRPCLFGNVFNSPLFPKDNFAGKSVLAVSFNTLNISFHSLLACKLSSEKPADNLMGILLYEILVFYLLL